MFQRRGRFLWSSLGVGVVIFLPPRWENGGIMAQNWPQLRMSAKVLVATLRGGDYGPQFPQFFLQFFGSFWKFPRAAGYWVHLILPPPPVDDQRVVIPVACPQVLGLSS